MEEDQNTQSSQITQTQIDISTAPASTLAAHSQSIS